MSTTNIRGGRGFIQCFTNSISNMLSPKADPEPPNCSREPDSMLRAACRKLRYLCSRLRWTLLPRRRRANTKVTIRGSGNSSTNGHGEHSPVTTNGHAAVPHGAAAPIRLVTFNAAMFSMAPAVNTVNPIDFDIRGKSANDRPTKGILRQQKLSTSKRRVSINLPEDEISVERGKQLNSFKGKAPAVASSFSFSTSQNLSESFRSDRSVLDVLKEVNADIIAVQNVKAEEEKGMKPLSDLANGMGMKYIFAESWAPEYGNAILSKWPIKQWKVQRICDDTDFRNVLKATIDIPGAGEVNFHCTYLDHLDENWRMKQISTILRSSDGPHIIAGGLNSLDETDYSKERWNDIVKYYEEIGKPTPKVEVMKFLKGKQYSDAKNFAGECESVVVVVKGQDVQGTCKYGTRVDYILASPNSPYKFVPGSYGVISSKGTSDHHIVKVDIVISKINEKDSRRKQPKQRVVKIDKGTSKGIWSTTS